MRNKISKMPAFAFTAALSLISTACGSSDSSGSLTTLESEFSVSESAAMEQFDITPLEKLLADPSMQSRNEQVSIENADIEIYAEGGNIYVLRFTLKEQIDITPEKASTVFDKAIGMQADVYQSARDDAADELGMEDLVIRVICVNADGTELYSADFK